MNLIPGEVHIWSASIDERYDKLLTNSYLSENEKRRSEMFSYDIDSFLYSVRHNLLRIILGHYLNCSPKEIGFKSNISQKPYIAFPITPIQFNISVSSNRFVAAFCQYHSIGVDIEHIRPFENIFQFTMDYLTKNEGTWIYIHPKAMVETEFFNIWSKKEALVKATGKGLSIDLNTFDVLSENPIAFSGDDWTISPLTISNDCAAAIAINSSSIRFSYYKAEELL